MIVDIFGKLLYICSWRARFGFNRLKGFPTDALAAPEASDLKATSSDISSGVNRLWISSIYNSILIVCFKNDSSLLVEDEHEP